jgi:hypothetical protein
MLPLVGVVVSSAIQRDAVGAKAKGVIIMAFVVDVNTGDP